MIKHHKSSNFTKKNYLIILSDLEASKQRGVWSLETRYTPGELAGRLRPLISRLSFRWVVYFQEIKVNHSTKQEHTMIKICKSITGIIERHNKSDCKTMIVPPNNPWNKTDEHRKELET